MTTFTKEDITACTLAISALDASLERSYHNSDTCRDIEEWCKGLPELDAIKSLELLKSRIEAQLAEGGIYL